MTNKETFEKTYEKPGAVWTQINPPEEIVELLMNKKIKPCKVLDVGCGEGFYSIYLAKKGFEVVGIDISKNAIRYSKENAKKAGVKINFIAIDVAELKKLNEKFDFVLEWGLLHSMMPEQRKKYVEDVSNLLNSGGKYLSICFNENDTRFEGPKQGERIVPEGSRAIVGSRMYFSSMKELTQLFTPYFKIIESKVLEKVSTKYLDVWNYFFMEKKTK